MLALGAAVRRGPQKVGRHLSTVLGWNPQRSLIAGALIKLFDGKAVERIP